MKRVVVTGMGMVTPLGDGVDTNWTALMASKSGIRAIQAFDTSDLATKIAGELPLGDKASGLFDANNYVAPKDQRKLDKFLLFAIAAAQQAVEDSGWKPQDDEGRERTGVMIGSGIGGLDTIYETALILKERGPRRVSPFFIPSALINLASGQVSIKYGFKGPNHSVVTACATGAHAIGDATRLIQLGDADVMVAGGAEAAICRLGIAGFNACKALATAFNDTPAKASRPWDKNRDGFVMGEGAGVVVVEDYEHARKRGATIYAEVLGYGMSGDAHHITAPSEDGDGAMRAMKAALRSAQLGTDKIDYINAHGTSTMADIIELGAVKKVFGADVHKLSMSSTKSATGHLLGAAGAIEAIYSIKSLIHQTVPPTLNLDEPDEGCSDVDLVPHIAKKRQVRYALSNSFGFGGTNASLILGGV
jgi:3-oxoacyl-[acyl-carrier-protein] synthase II